MKKKLKVIGLVAIACAIVTCIVFYIVKPSDTKAFMTSVWDFLNKPLPIVGFTTLMVLVFVWKVVVATKYGKKSLEKIETTYQNKIELLNEKEKTIKQLEQKCANRINELENTIIDVCAIIPNVKVNAIGEKIKELSYGEETTYSETKAE